MFGDLPSRFYEDASGSHFGKVVIRV